MLRNYVYNLRNYVEALDPRLYYTLSEGVKIRRYRVINNLLGPREFCPIVRKTKKLALMDQINIHDKCTRLIDQYPSGLLRRALTQVRQM